MTSSRSAILKKVVVYIPDNFITAQELAAQSCVNEKYLINKIGLNRKCVAQPSQTSSDMAIYAANKLLNDFDRSAVDLVIWTGSGKKDYNTWSASAFLIKKLSLCRAWGIDLFAQSACDVLGVRLAKNIIISDPSINKVLVVGGHKISNLVDYFDRNTSFLMNFSDGGSAALIEEGIGNKILGSHTITDGQFSDEIILAPKNDCEFFSIRQDISTFKKKLTAVSLVNYPLVISVAKNLSSNDPISFIGINHLNPAIHHSILQSINTSIDRSIYLSDFGHVGAADPWISIGLAEKNNILNENDLICIASAGFGYTWTSTFFRWNHPIINIIN